MARSYYHNLIDPATALRVREVIASAQKVAILCHITPDGDAMGSSLGLYWLLSSLGKNAYVITPDQPTHSLMFLPGANEIVVASRFAEKARNLMLTADAIFCLDFNVLKRIDRCAPFVEESKACKVLVDHHLEPEHFADIIVSHPECSSTSALLYQLIDAMGLERSVSRQGAECIFTGMMTDTGNFSYNSNDPRLYIIIANLLRKGIDKDRLYIKACNTNSPQRLRLCGYAIYEKMQLMPQHQMALITLTREELNKFDYTKGDTEGLVNEPLSIPSVVWSAFLREDEPGFVKISLRSQGNFPVNKICIELFGGGGHLNAAGGEWHGSLQEAVDRLLGSLDAYDCYLPR
ncbi:MAG: bifunctional oligoribonuclease/PAP phosphatase NrnA [Bacteroidales bacterium]|nr:bifunctional oligoribonuclease/PAP phosphatase NrnA [Bacteroidales bacterium]